MGDIIVNEIVDGDVKPAQYSLNELCKHYSIDEKDVLDYAERNNCSIVEAVSKFIPNSYHQNDGMIWIEE